MNIWYPMCLIWTFSQFSSGLMTNQTLVMYFILSGISDVPQLQLPIFLLVLLTYLITLGGNMTIFLLVCLDHHLHSPMYFFLCNLSILDMSSCTVTMHRVFYSFITGDTTISFFACMAQMYIFASLTTNELLLLTIMSYDRYVAICCPLRYHTVMCLKFCSKLTAICWAAGFLQVLPLVIMLSRITCFKTIQINHFFCDIMPLIRLPCGNIFTLELYNFVNGLILAILPFFLTFIPYIFIVTAILKIRSSTGRRKTFYTCSSHLTVIILLYTSLVCQYLQPDSMTSKGSNKLYSLFNTAAVPLLNPLIYSLKNKDVKAALRRRRRLISWAVRLFLLVQYFKQFTSQSHANIITVILELYRSLCIIGVKVDMMQWLVPLFLVPAQEEGGYTHAEWEPLYGHSSLIRCLYGKHTSYS